MRLAAAIFAILLACVICGLSDRGAAQESGAAELAPTEPTWYRADGKLDELPQSPQQWINSSPLSRANLKGKGLVLYFFEEECPSCRAKWPALLKAAELLREEPVVIVAVNSGNSADDVKSYVRQNKIDWPVIVDTDRKFEQTALAKEISLNNIHQVCVLTAGGDWHQASIDQLGLAAKAAADGGKWLIDPASMPEELKQARRDIELGNYAGAARAVMQAGTKGDDATKAAAKQLFMVVKKSMDGELAEIGKLIKSNEHWPAFKALDSFMAKYAGYPQHAAVAEKHAELGQNDEVKQQNRAAKKLAAAIRTGSIGTPTAVKRATAELQGIVKDFPDAEAASEAQAILDKLSGQ
jgi:thiol-disulfide isomerase/thioredoxin